MASQTAQREQTAALDDAHIDLLTTTAYSVANVRAMEQPLLAEGVPLMRMAARATAHKILQIIEDAPLDPHDIRVSVLVGAGDNGADGLFTGAMLAAQGVNVTAIAVGKQLHEQGFVTFVQSGGHIWTLDPGSRIPGVPTGFSSGEAGQRLETAIRYAKRSHIIVDAMTGIGVRDALQGIPRALAEVLGAFKSDEGSEHKPLVVAVDTPSGIGVDDGTLPGAYIPADITMMFGALKPCAMLPPAAYACGEINLVDFGFDLESAVPGVEMVDADFARMSIHEPKVTDSKYTRGVVGLITGSVQYPGAAVLSTTAAARSNIGMVRYLGPQHAQDLVLQALPEATMGKGRVEAWVVGSGVPGEDTQDIQREAIESLLAHYELTDPAPAESVSDIDGGDVEYSDAQQNEEAKNMPPIVVDAGALDLLPRHVPSQVVLTPHANELSRLLTRIDEPVNAAEIEQRPLYFARRAARLTGATVLLKGALTIVVGPDDDSMERVLVSGRAPATLATAGAGDVLAGMTGALLAQQGDAYLEDPATVPETAAAAAYLHGLAASLASHATQHAWNKPNIVGLEETDADESLGRPIIASDIVRAVPEAFRHLGSMEG